MKKSLITILLFIMAVSASGFDIRTGRSSAMAGAVLLSDPSASDYNSCPVGLISKSKILIETGYQRKFALDDLDKLFLTAAYGFDRFSASIGFSQFGRSDYYIEQDYRLTVGYRYNILSAAVIASGKNLEIGADERKVSLNAFSLGFAAAVNYKKYHLAVVADNLNRPSLSENAQPERITINTYAEIEGPSDFSITGHLLYEEHEEITYSLGQYIKLYKENALFWGISGNPLIYGGGVEIEHSGFSIVYGINYHPTLGFSHNISLSISFGGDEYEEEQWRH